VIASALAFIPRSVRQFRNAPVPDTVAADTETILSAAP